MSQLEPDRAARVSTLELFFDLVFVFTITQLTGVLVDRCGAAAVAEVVDARRDLVDVRRLPEPGLWPQLPRASY